MTPVARAGAEAAASDTARRENASQRTARGHRGPPRGTVPRRISGPAAAPARPTFAPRPATASRETLWERLAAFLPSLPDHPLLDRVVRGRAWIPLVGLMLVGIVAMQVELLKLNAATGRSIELISSLQSRNDVLRAHVAAASSPARIESLASHMGMRMPVPGSITFLRARSASLRRARGGIQAPNAVAFQAALQLSNVAVTPIPSAPATPGPGVGNSGSHGASGGAGASTGNAGASTGNTAATTTSGAAATTGNPAASGTAAATGDGTATTTSGTAATAGNPAATSTGGTAATTTTTTAGQPTTTGATTAPTAAQPATTTPPPTVP